MARVAGRRGRGCHATYTWIEERRWAGGLRARLDVGGDGVIEGWLLRLAFAQGRSVRARDVVGGVVVSEGGAELLLLPRLASGLGTVMLTLDDRRIAADSTVLSSAAVVDGASAAVSGTGRSEAPRIECVPEPAAPDADADTWRRSARSDYEWMAKEFNRQYINSHGKEHDEYQPHSAASELSLHYLNGRLWCFFGAVRNATRSLEENHVLLAPAARQGAHRAGPARAGARRTR